MAAYTQFGYGGYPPPVSQILASNTVQSPQPGDAATSAVNAARALSPADSADCRTAPTTAATTSAPSSVNPLAADLTTAPLSPDTLSQNSNAAGNGGGGGGGGGGSGAPSSSLSALENAALSQSGPSGGGGGGGGPASCCENGRPIMTDPVSGQTVCSCQYDSARLALSGYSRLPGTNVGVYGTPYPSTDQNPYQSIGVESSAFYSPLSNPYTLKDTTGGNEMSAWTSAGLQPTTGYYSYDPMSAYGYGASYDLAARRKNATRESTATLKAWLNEHKKNPYPTKGEKIMLAIITKMTLTQVSTWFANARRRLKKENKMTWEPKNRTDDDDEALASDDEKEKDNNETNRTSGSGGGAVGGMHSGGDFSSRSSSDLRKGAKSEDFTDDDETRPINPANDGRCGSLSNYPTGGSYASSHPHAYHPYQSHHPAYYQHPMHASLAATAPGYGGGGVGVGVGGGGGGALGIGNSCLKSENGDSKNQLGRGCGVPIPASKPKIWSLADTIASKTPPPLPLPPTFMGQQQQQQQHLHHPHLLEHQHMAHQSDLMQQHASSAQPQHTPPPPLQPPPPLSVGLSMHDQQSPQQHHHHQHHHHHHQQQQQQSALAPAPAPQHHHQQPQPQQQQIPSSMMSNFSAAPYYRAHTSSSLAYGSFPPGLVQAPMNSSSTGSSSTSSNNSNTSSSTTNNNNTNTNSIINSSTGPHTPTTPTSHLMQQQQQPHPHHQQQQQQQQQHHQQMLQQQHMRHQSSHHPSIVNQRGMGFPEAQPDTPPQTPPNMKMPSVATKLLFSASQIPTTATYRTTNHLQTLTSSPASSVSPRSKSMTTMLGFNASSMQFANVASGYGAQIEDYSPRDENSSSSSCDSASPHSHPNETNFKPLFKCQQIPVGGFAPHV